MARETYARINLTNAPAAVPAHIREHWHNHITSAFSGYYWSLHSPVDEGVALSADFYEPYAEEIEDPAGLFLADLLSLTFWHRQSYTEDLQTLISAATAIIAEADAQEKFSHTAEELKSLLSQHGYCTKCGFRSCPTDACTDRQQRNSSGKLLVDGHEIEA